MAAMVTVASTLWLCISRLFKFYIYHIVRVMIHHSITVSLSNIWTCIIASLYFSFENTTHVQQMAIVRKKQHSLSLGHDPTSMPSYRKMKILRVLLTDRFVLQYCFVVWLVLGIIDFIIIQIAGDVDKSLKVSHSDSMIYWSNYTEDALLIVVGIPAILCCWFAVKIPVITDSTGLKRTLKQTPFLCSSLIALYIILKFFVPRHLLAKDATGQCWNQHSSREF